MSTVLRDNPASPAVAAALPRPKAFLRWAELGLPGAALLALGVLPVLELGLRTFLKTGLPGCAGYVQNLTLWVGFLGAMLAARDKSHLNFNSGMAVLPPRPQRAAVALSAAVSTAVACGLAWASIDFVWRERGSAESVAGWVPVWVVEMILPVSFAVVALHFIAGEESRRRRAIAALGLPAAAVIGFLLRSHAHELLWPGIAALLAAGLFGAPIFVVLGGAALLLFFSEGVRVASIPVEIYRLVVQPAIPTIPLFTLTGFILAEGGASRRLLRLFRALLGWMPGGLPIVAILVCTFFTTFTGASGVTILALGGLLLPVLMKSGHREPFSVGLLTATGSIGILFPPSLPVILYGVVAQVPIPDLFRAGMIPGALLVLAVCAFGIVEGARSRVPRPAFDPREAAAALWEAKWEALLPVIAVAGIFGGYCTLIEAAAMTAVYALVIETVIHRDLHPLRDLPRALVGCVSVMGGVFIILGAAMGLTNYLVDAQVPMKAAAFVQAHIHSRVVFLLALNLFLFVVGCLMDIYSAIIVQVPLLLPISRSFGIDPLHLGIIFLANLELGYLTPPVGLNLFLASFRFKKPILRVFLETLPFLVGLAIAVLLITYVPALTLWTTRR